MQGTLGFFRSTFNFNDCSSASQHRCPLISMMRAQAKRVCYRQDREAVMPAADRGRGVEWRDQGGEGCSSPPWSVPEPRVQRPAARRRAAARSCVQRTGAAASRQVRTSACSFIDARSECRAASAATTLCCNRVHCFLAWTASITSAAPVQGCKARRHTSGR